MTETEINPIGIARIIESAVRLSKGADAVERLQLYRAAAAVIDECGLDRQEKEKAVKELKEALGV